MEDANNIRFGLDSIQQLAFARTSDSDLLSTLTEENLNVQFLTQTVLDVPNNRFRVKAGIKYISHHHEIFTLEMLYVFRVDDISKAVSIDMDNKRLDFKTDRLIPTFLNIAIGGLRGVIFEKMQDSPLSRFPLPLISTQLLVEKNTFHIEP